MSDSEARQGTWGAPPGSNRGGGPKTVEGRATALANLRGSDELVTHGMCRFLERGLAPACDKCLARPGLVMADGSALVAEPCEVYQPGGACRIVQARMAEIVSMVMAEDHITELQRPLVVEFAKCVAACDLFDHHIGLLGGPFEGVALAEGRLVWQPGYEQRTRTASRMETLAKELGLTPGSRVRFSLNREGSPVDQLAFELLEIEKRERAEREVVLEGEFEGETATT
jgi:hypothetical protein